MTLTIEITSDFICPWCWVAETRLQRALAQLNPAVDVQWVWQPFELNPDMPAAGLDRRTYRTQKFGSWAYSQQLDAQTVQATQQDGLAFRYDLMTTTPNTLQAHRLTGFAAQQGHAPAMAERLLRAYFAEGANIAEVEVLVQLAGEVGLDQDAVRRFLQSDAGISAMREQEQQAIAQGVHGVPNIRIGTQVLSGAQPLEVFVDALQAAVQALTLHTSTGGQS
ncbi:MAG: DsbA family oxidoreductase [Leptolyngbyaceae cyanobacterium]